MCVCAPENMYMLSRFYYLWQYCKKYVIVLNSESLAILLQSSLRLWAYLWAVWICHHYLDDTCFEINITEWCDMMGLSVSRGRLLGGDDMNWCWRWGGGQQRGSVRWGGCPTVSPDLRVHLGCLSSRWGTLVQRWRGGAGSCRMGVWAAEEPGCSQWGKPWEDFDIVEWQALNFISCACPWIERGFQSRRKETRLQWCGRGVWGLAPGVVAMEMEGSRQTEDPGWRWRWYGVDVGPEGESREQEDQRL